MKRCDNEVGCSLISLLTASEDLFQVLQLSKESLRADRLSHQVQTLSQWKIRGTELSRAMETLRAESMSSFAHHT